VEEIIAIKMQGGGWGRSQNEQSPTTGSPHTWLTSTSTWHAW